MKMKFRKYGYWFFSWFKFFGALISIIWVGWFLGWALSFFTVIPDAARNIRLTVWFIFLNALMAFITPMLLSNGNKNEEK